MSLRREFRLICVHSAATHMLFLLPVILPYYQSIGLSFRDFLIGEAVFSAMVILSEVPSGWISDVWKRRSTLLLGGFTAICGYALLMNAQGFWSATIAQGIIGIAVALNSGTNTALLYDRLHEDGKEAEYRRLDGHRHGISFYGTALSCFAGAFLFTVHPKLPLLFDLIALSVAMIAIACVREPVRFQKSVERNMFHDMKATMKYALTGHPEITGIIILSTVIMCTTKLMFWAQQEYYGDAGLPVIWFGMILTGTFIAGGIAGQLSHRAEKWGNNRDALAFVAAIVAIACTLLSAFTSVWLGIVLFFTGTLAYAVGQPRTNNAINSRVGPERRATILSTANLMVHFLFVPTSVIVGYVSEAGDIGDALLYMAGQLLVLSCIGLFLWEKTSRRVRRGHTEFTESFK